MLVSSNKKTMRHDVTYGAFPCFAYHVFQLHVVVQTVRFYNCHVTSKRVCELLFSPLPSLIGGVGKYRVGKYFHCLSQCDSVWWVVATLRVAMGTRVPCLNVLLRHGTTSHLHRHLPQAHLLVMSLMSRVSSCTLWKPQ